MIAWAKVILLFLQLVDKIYDFAVRQGYIEQGRDQVLGEMALALAQKAAGKKRIEEQVNAMSEAEVDTALRDLEPR